MSNGARLIVYLAAFIVFCVGAVVDVARSKQLNPVAFIAAGLALLTLVPLWDAVQAN